MTVLHAGSESQARADTLQSVCKALFFFNVGGDINEISMDHTHIPEASLHTAFNSIVIVTKSLSDIRKMSNPGINTCAHHTHTVLCGKRDLQKAVEKYF